MSFPISTTWVSNNPPKTFYGLYITPNKGETVRECIERCTVFNLPSIYPFVLLHIVAPCGRSVDYNTLDDIPVVDTPCPCGNPDHWFIKIGKVE